MPIVAFRQMYPEIVLLVMSCVVLMNGLFNTKDTKHRFTYFLAQFSLLAAFIVTLPHLFDSQQTLLWNQHFVSDALSTIFKLIIELLMMSIFVYSQHYVNEHEMPANEFYVLSLFSTLGMFVLLSANSFLIAYLGLELLSLPLYALVAFQRKQSNSSEAAIKYFIMGAVASGFFLYGISLLYGMTGSLILTEVGQWFASLHSMTSPQFFIAVIAAVFVLSAIAFKLGLVPFHMWVPDVYQGAPSNVLLIVSSVSKLAGLGLALRVLLMVMPAVSSSIWQILLIVAAVLSIGLGNLVAIAQTNLKRMLAYSAISQAGYIFLALASGQVFFNVKDASQVVVMADPSYGFTSAIFYMITYAVTVIVAFGLIALLSHKGLDSDKIDDLKGLNQRSPLFAFLMLLVMLSLAGIPPTVGFFAKWGVLFALVRSHHLGLAIYGMLFAVVGAFYYLRVIKVMYFDTAEPRTLALAPAVAWDARLLLSFNGLLVLYFGLMPAGLMHLCQLIRMVG